MPKKFWIVLIFLALIWTRFVGLDWGLPYPFHPDERNMVSALQSLTCDVSGFRLQVAWMQECFNPQFYAYGQLPLYMAYGMIAVSKFLSGQTGMPITYAQGALALRFISAISSIFTYLVLYKILKLFFPRISFFIRHATLALFTFSPYAIQFAHFGTTESLLMLLYSALTYFSLKLVARKRFSLTTVGAMGAILGVAIGVKISSLAFVAVPASAFLYAVIVLFRSARVRKKALLKIMQGVVVAAGATITCAAVSSPHNILNWSDFTGALDYEASVGYGDYRAFYTRQFEYAREGVFQLIHVLPYVLGVGQLILAGLGFFLLPWKDRRYTLLRIAILTFSLPTLILYAKWSRFLAPIYPLLTVFAAMTVISLTARVSRVKKYGKKAARIMMVTLLAVSCIHGVAYLSVYIAPDVRFTASEWIAENIEDNALILSETANVVDIPVFPEGFSSPLVSVRPISFDFYHVDGDRALWADLHRYISTAEYIFIPSRRVFANHTCAWPDDENYAVPDGRQELGIMNYELGLSPQWPKKLSDLSHDSHRCGILRARYPAVNDYYDRLFAGALGFEQVATFTSYPRIELFGSTLVEFPDEHAEETWTVFDHPVIRIYKRL